MNFFSLNVIQCFFFCKTKDKELNLFYYVLKNWPFFSNKTPRIMEFFWKTLRTELFWTLLEVWIRFIISLRIQLFFSYKTPRIEPFFNATKRFCSLNMTEKIVFFWIWLKELNFFSIWHKEIELFCWMWLKELNLFFDNVIQRVFSQTWL